MKLSWGDPAPRVRRASVVALSAALFLSGCGAAEKLSPRVAVRDAAKSTASQKEGTFTLSLVGSESDINALLNSGAALSDDDRKGLELVRNGQISVSAANGTFGLVVKAGNLDRAFELRYVGQKLYVRADVAELAKLAGTTTEELNATVSALASKPGFEWLSAGASGKWLSADLGLFKDLANKAGNLFGGAGVPLTTSSSSAGEKAPTDSRFKALQDAVSKALTEDIAIKKLNGDDVGDHYQGTVTSLRAFYAKIQPALQNAMEAIPIPGGQQLPPASAVPDKPASMDVWVKSGRVARLEVPLAQFDPEGSASKAALRFDIARQASDVAAPPDAVNVDVTGILTNLFGQFGGLLQGAAGKSPGYD
ncbi:MAG TPA: hypothetical protein VGR20_08115 [Acidimicrobiia bacterium]|nr:hypothetical protein [Acidimicrobiia bacterium]